ncbi:MAG: glycosyltransferase family 1 protein [Candidatus Saccharimonas sp.]
MKWIDITDMLAWSGYYTGIQRVTYEYAKRFNGNGAKFFLYDTVDDRFVEVSFDRLTEIDVPTISTEHGSISRRKKLRNILGAPYYRLSLESQAALRPYVDAANYTVRLGMDRVARLKKAHNVDISVYSPLPTAKMSKGDTVVMIGAAWNDHRVLDAVIKRKKQVGFRISQHINDILPIYQPQLFADELPLVFNPYVENVVKNADIITVISEATKRDLSIYCSERHIEPPLIEVLRLGDNPEIRGVATRPEGVHVNEYILAVGTFEVRKNYILLYQAYKLAQIEVRKIPPLIIVGRKGWLSSDIRHMLERDPFAKENIVWLSDVSDEEVKWLYQNCLFTVFPSIAEGWGLPVAESLQNGKFCLSSGVSSMLEIGNGLVDYFLPYDARECMEKILYYYEEDRYIAKNKKVLEKYTTFTWDDSYSQLNSILKG